MNINPLVKYFIIAEDHESDAENPQLINAYRILSSIHSVDEPPFPVLVRRISCLVGLTDGRGTGIAQVDAWRKKADCPFSAANPTESCSVTILWMCRSRHSESSTADFLDRVPTFLSFTGTTNRSLVTLFAYGDV